ncbi:MAG: hypothetical protein WKG07_07880 [Hymenobacter sp.]
MFSNMSNFIAPVAAGGTLNTNYKRAMHIRRNSALSVLNSVVANYPVGLLLDGTLSEQNAAAGRLVLSNNVYAGFARRAVATALNSSTYNVKQFLGTGNDTTATVASLLLNARQLQPDGSALRAAEHLAAGRRGRLHQRQSSGRLLHESSLPRGLRPGRRGRGRLDDGLDQLRPQITCYNRAGTTLAARSAADKSLEMGVYPNPTEGAARLSFAVARATVATVRIFDNSGRLVATVAADQKLAAGPAAADPADPTRRPVPGQRDHGRHERVSTLRGGQVGCAYPRLTRWATACLPPGTPAGSPAWHGPMLPECYVTWCHLTNKQHEFSELKLIYGGPLRPHWPNPLFMRTLL